MDPVQEKENPQPPKKKKKDKVRTILIIFFAAVFCLSAFMLAKDYYDRYQALEEFKELQDFVRVTLPPMPDPTEKPVETPKPDGETEPEPTEAPEPEPTPDFVGIQLAAYENLYEKNSDFYGWITIEGTGVDYPVMYTPRDTEYYLRKDFNQEYSNAGVPFIDGKCQPGGHLIIYGHNLRDNVMFAPILNYRDENFYNEHKTIRFDTLDRLGEYEIVAAFNSQVYKQNETDVFKYYYYQDLSDPDRFAEYVAQCKAASLYDTGVDAEYGDELITLSTCAYTYLTNLRFVVVAKLVRSFPEQPAAQAPAAESVVPAN